MIDALTLHTMTMGSMVDAARQLAWRSAMPVDAMESLIRRVGRERQRALVIDLTRTGANDDGDSG